MTTTTASGGTRTTESPSTGQTPQPPETPATDRADIRSGETLDAQTRTDDRVRDVLGIRNVRLYLGTQFLSQIGIWVQTVALNWVVYERTGSAANVGYLTAATLLPTLLLSLHGGVWADRLRKQSALLMTQSFLAVQGFAVAALFAASYMPPLWSLMLLMATKGIATALDGPLRQSFLSELVTGRQLARAVSLNATVFNTSMLLGAAIGGVLVSTLGVVWCMIVDAATHLVLVAGLLSMRRDQMHTPPSRPRRNVHDDLREGLTLAWRGRTLRSTLLALALACTLAMNTQVLLPGLAADGFAGDNVTFTLFGVAVAIGSIAGAFAAGRARHTARHLSTSLAGLAGAWLLATVAPHPVVAIAALAAGGYHTVYLMAQAATLLQQTTAAHARGRIMSIYLLLAIGSKPIGAVLVAWTGMIHPRGGAALATLGAALAAGVMYDRHRDSLEEVDAAGSVDS